MQGEWEIVTEAEVAASPDQVWAALATGQGLDGWFIGSSELQAGPGGALRSTMATFTDEFSVTAWEPGQRVAYRTAPAAEGGGFFALEWQVEGRAGGTKLRCVASGFLPGDDWEAEFESLKAGGAMYFDTLVQYLNYFSGRPAQVVDALGPPIADWDHGWRVLTDGLGLNGSIATGDQVRLTPAGLAPIDGVVCIAAPHILTVRASDALYRFLCMGPMALASHRLFAADVDRQQTEQAWQTWLNQLFT